MDLQSKIIEIVLPLASGIIVMITGIQARKTKDTTKYFPFAGAFFALTLFMVYVDCIR